VVRPDGPPGQIVERFLRHAAFQVVLSPAALEGRAAFVVTGDQELLGPEEHEGVRIVTPRRSSGFSTPERPRRGDSLTRSAAEPGAETLSSGGVGGGVRVGERVERREDALPVYGQVLRPGVVEHREAVGEIPLGEPSELAGDAPAAELSASTGSPRPSAASIRARRSAIVPPSPTRSMSAVTRRGSTHSATRAPRRAASRHRGGRRAPG
jgi:hypothetical protein